MRSYGTALLSASAVLLAVALVAACGSDEASPVTPDASADAGTNGTCTRDDECGTGECRVSSCVAGRCQKDSALIGVPLGTQTIGDCRTRTCDQDGNVVSVPDDADKPADEECAVATCTAGEKGATSKPPGSACTNGKCDSKGVCRQGLGASCANGAACQTGFCSEGFCCEDACTAECKSCGLPGKEGVCSNIARFDPDPSYTDPVFQTPNVACDVFVLCDGAGKCRKRIAKACAEDADCLSGKCFASPRVCLGAPGEACSSNGSCASGACNGQGACN